MSGSTHGGSHNHSGPTEHEESDVTLSPIVWLIVLTMLSMAITMVLIWGTIGGLQTVSQVAPSDRSAHVAAAGRQAPPEPRLQVDPILDIIALREANQQILNNYGWVDQPAGVVRMPIETAMDVLAKRGLPHRTGVAE